VRRSFCVVVRFESHVEGLLNPPRPDLQGHPEVSDRLGGRDTIESACTVFAGLLWCYYYC